MPAAIVPLPEQLERSRELAEWDLSRANAHFERAFRIDPFFLRARVGTAPSPEAETEIHLALVVLDEAIRLAPDLAEAYRLRGKIRYFRKLDIAAVVADYGQVVRLLPRDANAYYMRGLAYSELKQDALAFSDYSRAIDIDPENATVLDMRGKMRADRGDVEGALADFSAAIRTDRWEYPSRLARAKLYRNQGKLRIALADYDKAIAQNEDSEEAYLGRAEILDQLCLPSRAKADRVKAEEARRHIASIPIEPDASSFGGVIGGNATSSFDCSSGWDVYLGGGEKSIKHEKEETIIQLLYLPEERLHHIRFLYRRNDVTEKIDQAGFCYFGGDAAGGNSEFLARTFVCLKQEVESLHGTSLEAYDQMDRRAVLSGRVRSGTGFGIAPEGSHVVLQPEPYSWLEIYRYDEKGKERLVTSVRPEKCRVSH